MPLTASYCKRLLAQRIRDYGQPLSVTRLGRATNLTIRFVVLPMEEDMRENLQIEGVSNVGATQRYLFVCDYAADVRENDRVAYNGYAYEFATVAPSPFGPNAVNVGYECMGVRTRAA